MELVTVADGVHACLQPDEGLGYSNSGLVASGGGLVVDTFWDLPRTRELLRHYASVLPDPPRRLVNTHHNGDHCWGNQLLADAGAELIGHRLCAEHFLKEAKPAGFVALCNTPDDELGSLAGFVRALRRFDFEGIVLTPPTRLIEGDCEIDLGDRCVQLLYLGPSHTPGDVAVFLPEDAVLFTGDLLFNECTPIGWEGTYDTWIGALARMEALEPTVVVPGHGPITDVSGLRGMREYLEYVRGEARRCHEAGMSTFDAAKKIELGPYAGWNEPERLAFQVDRAYRELDGVPWDQPVDVSRVFAEVAALRNFYRSSGAAHAS